MHEYDFRCKDCGTRFTLHYKTYDAYDQAEPRCINCNSASLSRLITSVAIQRPARDYTHMSSGEMLSVLESGDSRQVGEMFEQVGGGTPAMGAQIQDATQNLLKGDSVEKVERDLRHNESPPSKSDTSTT